MADTVIWLLLQTALGLADWPLQAAGPAAASGVADKQPSTENSHQKQQPVLLPRPMYPGGHISVLGSGGRLGTSALQGMLKSTTAVLQNQAWMVLRLAVPYPVLCHT
jgi:hypothetical protein